MPKQRFEKVVNCPAFNLPNELTVQCPVCLEEYWAAAKWTSSTEFVTAVVECPDCGAMYRVRYEIEAYVSLFRQVAINALVREVID